MVGIRRLTPGLPYSILPGSYNHRKGPKGTERDRKGPKWTEKTPKRTEKTLKRTEKTPKRTYSHYDNDICT